MTRSQETLKAASGREEGAHSPGSVVPARCATTVEATTSLSAEIRALMVQRRALRLAERMAMPGDPRLEQAAALDLEVIKLAELEGLTEAEAWSRFNRALSDDQQVTR